MSSATGKPGLLLNFHPKLLERIGKVYAMRYRNEGKEAAQAWAYWHLPPKWMEAAIPYMKTAMQKAGIKLKADEEDDDGPENA